MDWFNSTRLILLIVVLGLILWYFLNKSQSSWPDTQSFDSLKTEYSDLIDVSSSGSSNDSSNEDGSSNQEEEASILSDLPEPGQAKIHPTLGQAQLSKHVPQIWTSQGDHLVRNDQGCDLLIN